MYDRKNWKTGKSSREHGDHSNIKNEKVIFFRLFLFFPIPIFFPKFSLTESDTVGPQLFTWSKKFRNYHIKAPKLFFSLIKPLYLYTF